MDYHAGMLYFKRNLPLLFLFMQIPYMHKLVFYTYCMHILPLSFLMLVQYKLL